MTDTIPVIAIAGPTGSGKSAFALALWEAAERGVGGLRGAELVNVDSAQIYRGMDLGTAKPDAATQAAVPHHLLDLLDPAETYSAARFAADAAPVVEAIRARGRLPILVGGTFLYYRALFEGLSELPPADASVRAALDAERQAIGALAQHARLAALDPVTAARLHPNDAQRVLRALEIHQLSGQAPSLRYADPAAGTQRVAGPVIRLALLPPDAAAFEAGLARRLAAMFAAGFVEEVRALRARGDLHLDLPSMRAVGYRQIWQHLDGEFDRREAEARSLIATRQYAKRQRTWLRGDPVWQSAIVAEPLPLAQVLNAASSAPR